MGMASVGSWSFRRKRTMQRVRIVKSIGLIGSVAAFLLLCSAQPFQPAPKLYRAKPEDVPPWAEQGNFRFIRLDGGQIESWKAERTWWGEKFNAQEKDVLTHIYGRDFEQMLGLLKQAEFNWIWVTWSNGWSLKDEDDNRENLKKVIAAAMRTASGSRLTCRLPTCSARAPTATIRKRRITACGCMASPCSTPDRARPICTSPGSAG